MGRGGRNGSLILLAICLVAASASLGSDQRRGLSTPVKIRSAPALHPQALQHIPSAGWSARPRQQVERKPLHRPPRRPNRWPIYGNRSYSNHWYGNRPGSYPARAAFPETDAAPSTPPVLSNTTGPTRSGYGPVIRRDGCSPKVYEVDPESGAIEIYCGHERKAP
jgi:hypothetical protein